MDQFFDWLERTLAVLFVPATLYGGCGALMRCRRSSRTLGQIISEVGGGAFTAHMLSSVIISAIPEEWHPVCFFLAGWGGLELVGRLYEAMAKGIEERLRRKIAGRTED